jgi:hypothetical protein
MLASNDAKCRIFQLAVCVRKNSNRFRPKFVGWVEFPPNLPSARCACPPLAEKRPFRITNLISCRCSNLFSVSIAPSILFRTEALPNPSLYSTDSSHSIDSFGCSPLFSLNILVALQDTSSSFWLYHNEIGFASHLTSQKSPPFIA